MVQSAQDWQGQNATDGLDGARHRRINQPVRRWFPLDEVRTTTATVTFHQRFWLKDVDRLLPPACYRVMTDEELIEGLSFPAYHRASTVSFVPGPSGCAVEMVTIDPLDLQAAQDRDAGTHSGTRETA